MDDYEVEVPLNLVLLIIMRVAPNVVLVLTQKVLLDVSDGVLYIFTKQLTASGMPPTTVYHFMYPYIESSIDS